MSNQRLLTRLKHLRQAARRKVEKPPNIRLVWEGGDSDAIVLQWPEETDPTFEGYTEFTGSAPSVNEPDTASSVSVPDGAFQEDKVNIRKKLDEKLAPLFDAQRLPKKPKEKQERDWSNMKPVRGYTGRWPPETPEQKQKALECLRTYPQERPKKRYGPFSEDQIMDDKNLKVEEF